MYQISIPGPADARMLASIRPGTFDHAIRPDELTGFLKDNGHILVIAQIDGEVVGLASGTILRHPDKAPAFFFNEVGVHRDFRRQGMGSALSRALMDEARARGCHGIWLATEADNTPARALYRALGARETRDVVVYDWDLPDL
jgi:ribosomal protein S18 acetylase RimI-like enzyme